VSDRPRRRTDSRSPRPFDRRALVGLTLLSALVIAVQIPGPHATAWHWFHDAARLLVGDGAVDGADGLSLYRDHPEFQFGPLSALISVPFSLFGRQAGSWLAILAASALGLVAVSALGRAAVRLRPAVAVPARRVSLVVGAVTLIVVWGDVAMRTAHLDDAVALAATAMAVWALADRRPWWATVLIGVAAAAKPWAIVFVPLLMVAPGPRRWLRPVGAAAVALATWAPFVLAEPATLDVRRYEITNEATSALRTLGVTGATTPDWARPAQLLGGLAVAGLLVLAGRWPAALMAGVAVRLVLDPAANRYYTAGLVLAVLVYEWVDHPTRVPWLAVGSAVLLEASQLGGFPPAVGGWMRIAVVAAVLAAAVIERPDDGVRPRPFPERGPPHRPQRRGSRPVSSTEPVSV
jgi:hypothetical protein